MYSHSQPHKPKAQWIGLHRSFSFLFKEKRVLLWSAILALVTVIITGFSFSFATDYIDGISKGMFEVQNPDGGWWSTAKSWGLSALSIFYFIGTRIICFYLSFLTAYAITSPGYFFLSHAAEKIYAGENFDPDAEFTLKGAFVDFWEGIKIALMGVVVTVGGFALNFIPLIGQLLLVLVYTMYSALIFIDYPASRRRWSLGEKIRWVQNHRSTSLRLGIFPALVGFIPFVNIFAMALIFPLMTVHATLNFANIEIFNKKQAEHGN